MDKKSSHKTSYLTKRLDENDLCKSMHFGTNKKRAKFFRILLRQIWLDSGIGGIHQIVFTFYVHTAHYFGKTFYTLWVNILLKETFISLCVLASTNYLNNCPIDEEVVYRWLAKWKTRELRQIQSADPVATERKLCLYTILKIGRTSATFCPYRRDHLYVRYRNLFSSIPSSTIPHPWIGPSFSNFLCHFWQKKETE